MNLKMKLMAAAAVALVTSAGAHARIVNSASGNGDLFFTMFDIGPNQMIKDDDRTYVRDLGWLPNGGQMNNWVSPVTTAPLPPLNADKQGFGTIYHISPDANLLSFLAGTTDTSRLRWNIVAADSHGTDRILTTARSISDGEIPIYIQFRILPQGVVDVFLPYANNNGLPENGSVILTGDTASINLWGNTFAGRANFVSTGGLGSSLGFYALSERVASGSPVVKADLRQFMADSTTPMTWTLATNGDLIYGAVPEPSGYALMLAGLGLVGFMARRRLGNRV